MEYIDYCKDFLKRPENADNYRRYGFSDIQDLKEINSWNKCIDTRLKNLIHNSKSEEYNEKNKVYFELHNKLVALNIKIPAELRETYSNFFKKVPRKNKPNPDVWKIIKVIFDIDISHSQFNENPKEYIDKMKPKADITTYVSMDMNEIKRRNINMLDLMNTLIDIDCKVFPKEYIASEIIDAEEWVNIFQKNYPFVKIAYCNGFIVGYFDYFMVSEEFYSEWLKGNCLTIQLMEKYQIIHFTDNQKEKVNVYIYLDIFCIDLSNLTFDKNLETIIRQDLQRQLKAGIKELKLARPNTNVLGIIADGVTERGKTLLELNGFDSKGISNADMGEFKSELFQLDIDKLKILLG